MCIRDSVVGVLQFEVLEYRLKNEYNVDVRRTALPYAFIRWIDNEDVDPKTLNLTSDTRRVEDFKGRHLLLFTSAWNITWAEEHLSLIHIYMKNELEHGVSPAPTEEAAPAAPAAQPHAAPAQPAPAPTPRRVRRVGTFTMGLCLVIAGIALVAGMFRPGWDMLNL